MSFETASTRSSRDRSHPRRGQRGAILLLMFLVIVVLTVVIVQMRLASTTDGALAQNAMREFRFEFAAKGAFENARALLVTDLRDEELDAQANSAGGEDSENGEPTGGNPNFGGSSGGPGGEEQTPPNDAMTDNWADPGQANQQLGDIDVRTRIVDEDRKFNLLSIVARDEDFRELSRERAIRLLDTFREGTRYDLSYGDSSEIVDGLAEWFQGERPSGFPTPPPRIVEEEPGARFDDSEQRFADDAEEPIHYPLSFDELLMIDKLDESILYGVYDDGKFVPGLCDVATIFSNLVFESAAFAAARGPIEEDDASNVAQPGSGAGSNSSQSGQNSFQNPFGTGGESGEGGESTKGNEEEPQGPPTDAAGQLIATETQQGRININTAPLAVLRVLVSDEDIPYSVLEKIDEFRRTALDEELLEQARRRGYGSDGEGKSDEKEDEDSGFGNDEEEDAEALKDDFTFHKADEVFEKVQDFFDTNFELPEEARLSFQSAIDVKSHVFTIYIELRDRKAGSGGGDPFDMGSVRPPDAIYRAIVWRRKEGEGFQTVPILPLHPWHGTLPPETEDYRKEFPFGF